MSVQLFIDADQTPVNQRNSVYQWDDFQSSTGDLNWDLVGTGATLLAVNGNANHPGQLQLLTDTTSGHSAQLQRYDFIESDLNMLEWVFKLNTSGSVTFRIGSLNSLSSPSFGVAVEFDTALSDTALSLVKWVSGVRTVGATLALNATHWYRMGWSRTGSGTGTLTLNDIDAATSQSYAVTGLTAGAAGNAGAYIKTNAASQASVTLDWFLAALTGMSR